MVRERERWRSRVLLAALERALSRGQCLERAYLEASARLRWIGAAEVGPPDSDVGAPAQARGLPGRAGVGPGRG